MSFLRPEALLWLLALIPWWWWESTRAPKSGRRWPVVTLRGVALLLAGLALARPILAGTADAHWTLVIEAALDETEAAERHQAYRDVLAELTDSDEISVILAGASSRVLTGPSVDPRELAAGALVDARALAPDLGSALNLALVSRSASDRASVVVIPSARESTGVPESAAALAHARGVPIHLRASRSAPPRNGIVVPSWPVQVVAGSTESIPIDVFLADSASRARLDCDSRGRVQSFALPGSGRQKVELEWVGDPGVLSSTLSLWVNDEATPAWQSEFSTMVLPAPTLALVTEAKDEAALASVRDLLSPSFRIEPRLAAELERPGALDGTAGAILSDVPAAALSSAAESSLLSRVKDGYPLFVAGGPRSFGPGGYLGTDLEAALPLRSRQREERRDPSATLVIVIDTSGSMMGQRIDLAKEVARLALQRLKPHDKAGIVEFHGAKRWAAPIQPAANAVEIQRALNRLTAGGGTVIYPAMEEAYYAMLNVRTRTRHLLVVTDGGVEEGDFEGLVRKMAEHGMTVSTVLVGESSGHSDFLVSLAQWGKGRNYHAPDRFRLPEVLVKQPETALLSPIRTESISLLPGASADRRRNLLPKAALEGRLEMEARPTAEVLWKTPSEEPVLARWHHGLGPVVAYASQLAGPWSRALAQDPEYARALCALLRAGIAVDPTPLRIVGGLDREVLGISLQGEAPSATLSVEIVDGRGGTQTALWSGASTRSLSESWRALFYPLPVGPVKIEVRDSTGRVRSEGAGLVNPPAVIPRAARTTDLWERLARKSGGTAGGERLPPGERGGRTSVEIWPYLMLLCLAVSLTQVVVRRLPSLLLILLCFVAPTLAQETSTLPLADQERALRALVSSDDEATKTVWKELRARNGEAKALTDFLERKIAEQKLGFPARRQLAFVLAAEGRSKEAFATLGKAAAEPQVTPEEALFAGRIAEAALDSPEAERWYERCLAAGATGDVAHLARRRLFALLADRGDRSQAEAHLTKLVEGAGTPDEQFTEALLGSLHGLVGPLLALLLPTGEEESDYRATMLRAQLALQAGRSDLAEAALLSATTKVPRERERRYVEERQVALHRRQGTLPALAERWLAEAASHPERDEALVSVLRELKRPKEALDLLVGRRGEVQRQGERASLDLEREIIALGMESGQGELVIQLYRSLIEQNPSAAGRRSGLALALLLRGERPAAEGVFRERIPAATPKELLRLAQAAAEVSLEAVATECAEAAAKSPEESFRAALFLVLQDQRRGMDEEAIARLKELEATPDLAPEQQLQLGDAYERLKREDSAVRILEALRAKTGAEDLTMRLAWLLERKSEPERALELWLELWRTTEVAARVSQAESRILALGVKKGRLADLAIDLEAKLDRGEGTPREFAFLVKIYANARDPVAAVEILNRHSDRIGNGLIETIEMIAHVLQQADDYPGYERALWDLQQLVPDQAVDYQQQLALGALERGKGREVKAALDDLRTMSPDNPQIEEFAAGCLALVELHDEGARAYARVLARHPERAEAFLLLGNCLRDAGRTPEAIGLYLQLLDEAPRDDVFTIAVDGLLNLQAEPGALRMARRRTLERLAADPARGFYYELTADLSSELRDQALERKVTELFVVVAGERRSATLRELMDLAADQGRGADLIAHGQSLLALGEEVPPEVFLRLGEALVAQGDLLGAERAFSRLRAENDFVGLQKRIAQVYEGMGYWAESARLLRQALIARPTDVELLIDAARCGEIAGETERSARDYEQAMDLLLQGSRSRTEEKLDTKPERGRKIRLSGGVVYWVGRGGGASRQLDSFARLSPGLIPHVRGLATPARRDALQAAVLSEVAMLTETGGLEEKLAAHPRLERLVDHARDLAVALDLPAEAVALETRVLEGFPKDEDRRKGTVAWLREQGYPAQASELVSAWKLKLDGEDQDAPSVTEIRSSGERLEAWLAKPIAPGAAGQVALPLLMLGDKDIASRVLDRVDRQDGADVEDLALCLRLAHLTGDTRRVAQFWSRIVASSCEDVRPYQASGIAQLLIGLLPLAPPGSDVELQAHLRRMATNDSSAAILLAAVQRGLGESSHLRLTDIEGALEKSKQVFELVHLFEVIDPADRAAFIDLMMQKSDRIFPYNCLQIVEAVGEKSTPEIDLRVKDLIANAFGKTKRDEVEEIRYFIAQVLTASLPEGRRRFILQSMPDKGGVGPLRELAEAVLMARCGELEGAEERVLRHIDLLFAPVKDDYATDQVRRILSAESALQPVLERILEARWASGNRDVALAVWRARVKSRGLQFEAALETLQAIPSDPASDDELQEIYQEVYESLGRASELAQLSAKSAAKATSEDSWTWIRLAHAHFQAQDLGAARDALKRAGSQVDLGFELGLAKLLGDQPTIDRALRRAIYALRGGDRWHSRSGPLKLEGIGLERPIRETRNGDYVSALDIDSSEDFGVGEDDQDSEESRSLESMVGEQKFAESSLLTLIQSEDRRSGRVESEAARVWARCVLRGPGAAAAFENLDRALASPPGNREAQILMRAMVLDSKLSKLPEFRTRGGKILAQVASDSELVRHSAVRLWECAQDLGETEFASRLVQWGELLTRGTSAWLLWEERRIRALALDRRADAWKESLGAVSKSEIQPDGVPFALALARKWASLGEREKARELRDRARDALTRDPQTRPEDLRRFEFQRFQAAVTEGDLDSARVAAATLRALAKEAASEWHQNLAEVLPTKLPPGVTAPALFDLLLSELKLREDLSLSTREQWSLSLAEWMARRGDPKAALAFFESEPSLQSKRATTRHLKADLLKAAGRLPESRALEETLLAEGALHPTRYERVLSDLVTRDRAAGLTAAQRLARSTDDPAVLDWAIEAARAAGQVDEAQRLLDRLAVRAPDHPRLKAAAPR